MLERLQFWHNPLFRFQQRGRLENGGKLSKCSQLSELLKGKNKIKNTYFNHSKFILSSLLYFHFLKSLSDLQEYVRFISWNVHYVNFPVHLIMQNVWLYCRVPHKCFRCNVTILLSYETENVAFLLFRLTFENLLFKPFKLKRLEEGRLGKGIFNRGWGGRRGGDVVHGMRIRDSRYMNTGNIWKRAREAAWKLFYLDGKVITDSHTDTWQSEKCILKWKNKEGKER